MKKLLFVLMFLTLTGCSQIKTNEDYMTNGQNYLVNYEYDDALFEFQKGIDNDPTNYRYYLASADIYLKKGQTERGIEVLTDSYSITPHEKTANALGELYLNDGVLVLATQWFDKAIATNTSHLPALIGKAKISALTGTNEKTTEFVMSLKEEDLNSTLLLMQAIVSIDDPNKASQLILKSTSVDNDNQELAKELRMVLTAYEQENNLHNLSNIVYTLLNHGWFEFAQVPLNSVIKDNQFYETSYVYQGLINLYTNRLDLAKENFIKTQELNPNNIDSRIFLIQTEFLREDPQSATNIFEEVYTKFSAELNLQQFVTVVDILHKNNQRVLLEKVYLLSIDRFEVPIEQKIKYYEALVEMGKFEQADAFYNDNLTKSTELTKPEISKVGSLRAYCLFNLNKRQEGLEEIKKAEEADNSVAVVYYYKGKILFENSDPVQARVALDRSIELDLDGETSSKALEFIESNEL